MNTETKQNRKARAARMAGYEPVRERIESIGELAALVRGANARRLDHWTINEDIFFGDFGGMYVSARHYAVLYDPPGTDGARGFVEIPDERIEDVLRREWEEAGALEFTDGHADLYEVEIRK